MFFFRALAIRVTVDYLLAVFFFGLLFVIGVLPLIGAVHHDGHLAEVQHDLLAGGHLYLGWRCVFLGFTFDRGGVVWESIFVWALSKPCWRLLLIFGGQFVFGVVGDWVDGWGRGQPCSFIVRLQHDKFSLFFFRGV